MLSVADARACGSERQAAWRFTVRQIRGNNGRTSVAREEAERRLHEFLAD